MLLLACSGLDILSFAVCRRTLLRFVSNTVCCMQGFVVGFHGPELYCLNHPQTPMMQTLHVPLSAHLREYLEQSNVDGAYQVLQPPVLLISKADFSVVEPPQACATTIVLLAGLLRR